MGLQEHKITADFDGQPIHFQLLILEKQIFVWIGTQPRRLSTLCVATPTRMDPLPSATALLRGPDDDENKSMSQRLAKKTGRSVMLSINLPANPPDMRAFAERRLLQELRQLQLVPQAESQGS